MVEKVELVRDEGLGPARLRLGGIFEDIYEVVDGVPRFKLFIDGRWEYSSGKEFQPTHSPIDGSVIAYVSRASKEDAVRAVETAEKNQPKIRSIAAIERISILLDAIEIMRENFDYFVDALVIDGGKPRHNAESEVKATMERMRMTMQEARKIFGEYIPGDWSHDTAGKIALVIREPVGVVAAIGPFNYPLYIPAAKIIPALVSGNSVVAKPSSYTPITLLLFAKVLQEAGLPDGVFQVITGPGRIGSEIASHPSVGVVSFTGSTEVGKELYRVSGMKHMHLELGGKAYAIVLEDADLKLAATKCVDGSFANSGQRCDAISSVLVMESVADEFVNNVLERARQWKWGDPRIHDVMMGPLIDSGAAERVHSLVKDALDKGAELLMGGYMEGAYYAPTVLDRVPEDAKILWEEIFGPVVVIKRIKSVEEAIEITRKSRYGLDSCIFTNNFYNMWRIAKAMKVGEITINDMPRHGVGFFPFGGVKDSGIGREGIGYSIDEMTVLKTIVFNLEPAKLGKGKRQKKQR